MRKSKKNIGGYTYNSPSNSIEIYKDDTFLRIVENTRIINKEKNKNTERQSDKMNYATFLIDSDIDDLISTHETLDRNKIKQLVNTYIKKENAKKNKKSIKSWTNTSNKTVKKRGMNTI